MPFENELLRPCGDIPNSDSPVDTPRCQSPAIQAITQDRKHRMMSRGEFIHCTTFDQIPNLDCRTASRRSELLAVRRESKFPQFASQRSVSVTCQLNTPFAAGDVPNCDVMSRPQKRYALTVRRKRYEFDGIALGIGSKQLSSRFGIKND